MNQTVKLVAALLIVTAFGAGLGLADINDDLFKAIEAKDIQKVKELVASGADVNAKGKNLVGGFRVPLQVALGNLQPEIAAFLIEKGADPNYADSLAGQTHLIRAAGFGYAEVVGLLLKKGAAVNVKETMLGQTALMNAAMGGRTEVAKLLIENGADLGLTDESGETALHLAMTIGCHSETIKLLAAKGANLNARTNNGSTPLMYAVSCPGDVVGFLIKNGADVNATTSGGGTALMYAAKAGQIENAKLLIASGADVNAKTAKGSTALSLAEANDMITLLRQSGAQGDKMPIQVPAALSAEDIKFATEQCQILRPDVDAIPKLEKKVKDLLFARIVRRDCNLLAGFKASRGYFAQLKAMKKGDKFPMPPGGWDAHFLTDDEIKVYQKILDSW